MRKWKQEKFQLGKYFLQRAWLNTGTYCPEML